MLRVKILLLSLVPALAACGQTVGPSGGTTTSPLVVSQPPSTTPPSTSPPASTADFVTRCQGSGVVRCIGFDSSADVPDGNVSGANFGTVPSSGDPTVRPTLDTTVKASGASSLKFTIPANSAADTSGSFFTNFSGDLSRQFGENQTFYVQWRQRFDPVFITTQFASATGTADGWKQVIIGTGDQPGTIYFSCTALEVVTINSFHRGFPQMYNSCTGSSLHPAFYGFEEPFNGSDFKLQNARPSPYCLYSQGSTSYFPPTGNCFPYVANEWMTFQVRIQTGPRMTTGAQDVFQNSYVTLWLAREGQPSQLLINWGPYDLAAGDPTLNQKYGKVWLLPYNTNKTASVTYPVTYTWYDELIISTAQIADPK